MKKTGVNGAVCSCVQTINIAMITGAKQAGINLKAGIGASGVDPSLFATAAVTSAAQGSYWETFTVPLGTNSAINNMVANLKKYDSSYPGGSGLHERVGDSHVDHVEVTMTVKRRAWQGIGRRSLRPPDPVPWPESVAQGRALGHLLSSLASSSSTTEGSSFGNSGTGACSGVPGLIGVELHCAAVA